jgi:hypothetical protein
MHKLLFLIEGAYELDRAEEGILIEPVIFRRCAIDLDPLTHLLPSHRLKRDDLFFAQKTGRNILGHLNSNPVSINTCKELPVDVIGRIPEHLPDGNTRKMQQHGIEHLFVFRFEIYLRHKFLTDSTRTAEFSLCLIDLAGIKGKGQSRQTWCRNHITVTFRFHKNVFGQLIQATP